MKHPPESIDTAATWNSPAGDTGLLLAGPGAPLVSEFSIAEFALAIGRSTDSGRAYLATAVELKYRLPRTWGRVLRGDLPAWRARRVAEATFALTFEAAAFVDAQVSAFAHKIGHAALERLVGEAINRFMPDQARKNAEKAAEGRHVSFHHDQVTFNGTTHLEGELDLADALDLDTALAHGAEQLKACGSEQPSTCAVRWPPESSPADNSPSTSRLPPTTARPTAPLTRLRPPRSTSLSRPRGP